MKKIQLAFCGSLGIIESPSHTSPHLLHKDEWMSSISGACLQFRGWREDQDLIFIMWGGKDRPGYAWEGLGAGRGASRVRIL